MGCGASSGSTEYVDTKGDGKIDTCIVRQPDTQQQGMTSKYDSLLLGSLVDEE